MPKKKNGKTKGKSQPAVKNPGFPAAFWRRIPKPKTAEDIRDFNILAGHILEQSAANVAKACEKARTIEEVVMILEGDGGPRAGEMALDPDEEPMAMHMRGEKKKYLGKTEVRGGVRTRMAKIDAHGRQIDPDNKQLWDSIKG